MLELLQKNRYLRQQALHVVLAFGLIVLARTVFASSPAELWLWGLAFAIGGYHKALEGLQKTIENKALNVEFLMIMAATAAFMTQDYQEGAVLIFIFAISGVLEKYANLKSERALTKLLELTPKTALLLMEGHEVEVPVAQLKVHDHVLVKAGQYVPADGRVLQGEALINQAPITGEFISLAKGVGDEIFAGSINEDASLIVEVMKDPKASTVQKIIDFVQQAQASQTRSQTLIERFEMWYVYVVIALAIAFFAVPYGMGWLDFNAALYRGVIVLVVGSPCAVVASITPAILSTLSFGASRGILIKGGVYLEALSQVTTVVFDKTGTITTGEPQVRALIIEPEFNEANVLKVLVNLERRSTHPLARAIATAYAEVERLELDSVEVPGQGMRCKHQQQEWFVGRPRHSTIQRNASYEQAFREGYTLVDIVCDETWVGYVALSDTLREGAHKLIETLNHQGIKTLLLTGDTPMAAQKIASATGIERTVAQCLPEDKVKEIEALKAAGEQVLMIGDGINDAPSLALAQVGAAMGNATDVTLETADLVFVNNRLSNIVQALNVSRRMRRIVRQNLIFSISVIVALLISNIWGVIELPSGVLAHEGSTILVILNSLRLLRGPTGV
jgi:Cd2+/Zn2+-exporting ATPase